MDGRTKPTALLPHRDHSWYVGEALQDNGLVVNASLIYMEQFTSPRILVSGSMQIQVDITASVTLWSHFHAFFCNHES